MQKRRPRPDLVFERAIDALVAAEGKVLLEDISERSTCGRLALYLQQQLSVDGFGDYYADVEYNRKQRGQVKTIIRDDLRVIQITPDLIAHTRGEKAYPDDNLIAVEVKKSIRPEREKQADRERLQAMTTVPFKGVWPWDGSHPEHVCGYAVGIYVEIDLGQRQLRLDFYKKGVLTESKVKMF